MECFGVSETDIGAFGNFAKYMEQNGFAFDEWNDKRFVSQYKLSYHSVIWQFRSLAWKKCVDLSGRSFILYFRRIFGSRIGKRLSNEREKASGNIATRRDGSGRCRKRKVYRCADQFFIRSG